MTSTNAKILLVLLGIGLLVASGFLVAKPKYDSCKVLQSEVDDLQVRLDDLIEKEKHKDEILAETEEFNKQFEAELVNYPADLNQESFVMFLKGIEESLEFGHVGVSLPEPSTFYVLGEGSAAEGATVDEDTADETYVVQTTAYGISYRGTYDDLKKYLDYIANYKYRVNLSTLNIAYNQEAEKPIEECTGTVTLNAYSISGPDRVPDKPTVDVKEGKDVIFEDITGGNRASTSFDEDEGASIVANHNIVINLVNANSDTSSGIIVASNESDEATYVTSSNNSVENLSFSIEEREGKNYIKYALGSKSYETEVTSSNVTIYVKSSARVNSDDKNGVNVSIDNSTGLSVYIKVADDDSSNPRFSLGSKTGTVKVY